MRRFSRSDILCVLGTIACCFTGFAPVAKYFHGSELVIFAIAIAFCVAMVMLWLRWFQVQSSRDLNILWLAAPWCVFTLLFILLFPIASRHTLGLGSDRVDALRISAAALVHHHYPYRAQTYLGNPITPLPGAIFFAVPFYLLGNISLQNLLWLALFVGFSNWFFRRRSTAIVCVLILLGASAANLDDFVVGGDYLVNAFYVCIAMAAVMTTHKNTNTVWMQTAAAVFFGLAINSRPIYVVAFPLLIAFVLQCRGGAAAFRLLLVSGAVAALFSLPFYFHDPAHFSPLHLRDKLDFFPAWLHAGWLLVTLGLLASFVGFLIRLTPRRVFLLTGASLLVMLGPPAIIGWFLHPFTLWGWFQLDLITAPALFFCLWMFANYENAGMGASSKRPERQADARALS